MERYHLQIRFRAYLIWEFRQWACIPGTSEDDWFVARGSLSIGEESLCELITRFSKARGVMITDLQVARNEAEYILFNDVPFDVRALYPFLSKAA